jgi:hypothetical protein
MNPVAVPSAPQVDILNASKSIDFIWWNDSSRWMQDVEVDDRSLVSHFSPFTHLRPPHSLLAFHVDLDYRLSSIMLDIGHALAETPQ